jgi:2-iminoacetate synthase
MPDFSPEEIRARLETDDPEEEKGLFAQAAELTKNRFGRRIVLFAPLYVSNVCVNNCLYCGFRRDNALLERQALSAEEVQEETKAITAMGHRTILVVAGEHPEHSGPQRIARDIQAVRSVSAVGDIKVEVMPLDVKGYRRLREAGARGVTLYQETYDRTAYARAHPSGPKAHYDWRLAAPGRVLEAGFRRIGLGILVGLADAASDASALIAHARSLHARFGFWPSTISLPRLQPAPGAPGSLHPPHPVDEQTFLRLSALLRVALPEVGMALSTRESPAVRDRLLELGIGVTHLSAGSRTDVGGYTQPKENGQFSIQDDRPVAAVVDRLKGLSYEPVWAEEERYNLNLTPA